MPTVSLWVCAGISVCLAKLPFASQTIMHLVKTHAQSVQFNNGITLTGNTSDELWEKQELQRGDLCKARAPAMHFIEMLSKANETFLSPVLQKARSTSLITVM